MPEVPSAITTETLMQHLRLPPDQTSEQMARLGEYAAAATLVAEDTCRVGPIVARPVTVRKAAVAGILRLTAWPVFSVTTLTGPTGRALDTATLQISSDGVTVAGGLTGGDWTVTYLAGRYATADDVPPNLALGVCILAKHLWDTQRGRAVRGSALAGEPEEQPSAGFLVPHRARLLLQPFEQLAFA